MFGGRCTPRSRSAASSFASTPSSVMCDDSSAAAALRAHPLSGPAPIITAGASPVPVQMWQWRAQSRRRCETHCEQSRAGARAHRTRHMQTPTKLRAQAALSFAECDAMRCDAMRCDAVRCDAMRCDAMRCDAVRCDAMRCDAMRCGAMRACTRHAPRRTRSSARGRRSSRAAPR